MQLNFIPIDFDYVDVNDKSVIRIFGRTADGKRCCVIDNCEPYFWLLPKAGVDLQEYAKKVSKVELEHAGRHAIVTRVEIKDKKFLGKDVKALQVFVQNPKDIIVIKDAVKRMRETEAKKEIDINFVTRYIIEKNVRPLMLHAVQGKELSKDEVKKKGWDLNVDIIVEASSIKFLRDESFEPKILAFDIEASEFEVGKGQILMISLADKNIQKVITWKHFSNAPNNIEFVHDEVALIKRFKEIVKEYKPDCLVGYFSDGFDLPYLKVRADKHKIKLNLGLDGSSITFLRGIIPSSKITGLVNIDLYKFISNIISPILQSETLSLGDVARELIGEQKVEIDLSKITRQLQKGDNKINWKRYCLYNLQDAVLTAKLFAQLWPNIAEMAKIVNEPTYNVSRASYSQLVEHYLIHNLKQFNEICANRPTREKILERRARGKYVGAFVFQPKPALYERIAVFDFRSLYPSIIISFNISPASLQSTAKNAYTTPQVEFGKKKKIFYFNKTRSFIPILLKKLIDTRKEVKKSLKRKRTPILEARDYGLKTLSNATYGYYAFFGARYYSIECAASITAFGRYFLRKVIDEINKAGFGVIYADTDGIAFTLGKKTEKQALNFLAKLNRNLPEDMELELENFYTRGIFVTKRTGEIGAKKKYALLVKDGSMKIRGFETVRRDWCNISRKVQDKILGMILKEGSADSSLDYVKGVISDIRNMKIPVEDLIIRTQLKKGVEEYVAIGPHVAIAKKMLQLGMPVGAGSLIEYVVAQGKQKGKKAKAKERIREKARLPDEVKQNEYDSDYYIEHQIIPAVEHIFAIFGIPKEQLLESKKQRKLHEF